jgi:hypothetical protein
VLVDVHPVPSDEEREAILAALGAPVDGEEDGWSATALLEGVEEAELEP